MKQFNNEKIIFFGSSSYVAPIIEALNKNFDLALVVTTERLTLEGKDSQAPVANYCVRYKIPYLSVQKFNSLTIQQLKKSGAKLGILADFGLIVSKDILSLFPKGIINIHPSLLPKYRGPTPIQTAILNGEKTTGISIIKLDEELDHGPILIQQKEEILPQDTAKSLYERLFLKSANLLPDIINKYLNENLKLNAQNHKNATFTKPLTRADGYIDLKSLVIRNSKLEIARKIRAYYPWPGVFTKSKISLAMAGQKSKIIKFLPEQMIQVEGKKPTSYKDFINGYPNAKEIIEKLI